MLILTGLCVNLRPLHGDAKALVNAVSNERPCELSLTVVPSAQIANNFIA